MVGHGQVADAHAHALALPRDHGIDSGKRTAVEGPQIEIQHGAHPGCEAPGVDVVGVEKKHVVTVDDHGMRVGRMRDPGAHHAHRHLCGLVGVRVIHEGSRALRAELVYERLPGLDGRLIEARHAVHAVGQPLAMPVNASGLGKAIGDEQAHPIALDDLDGRSRRLSVVAPEIGFHPRRDLPHHGLGHQMKFLHSVAQAPGKRPAVERRDRFIGSAAGRHQRRARGRFGRGDDFGKCRQRGPADRCRGERGHPGE